MSHTLNTDIAVVGIDIGKNSFHLGGLDGRGAIGCVRGGRLAKWKHDLRTCRLNLIGMEACVGAHHLSRKLRANDDVSELRLGLLITSKSGRASLIRHHRFQKQSCSPFAPQA